MAVNLEWHGDEFMRYTDRQQEAGLDASWIALQAIARRDAGKTNTGRTIKITRPRAGGNKTSRTDYPNSSKPGEPPRRRTGFGQKNIVGGRRGLVARVGYTGKALYMIFHELGIRYKRKGLQQRATIVPALIRSRHKLASIYARAARAVRP